MHSKFVIVIASVLATFSATAQDTEREQVTPKRVPGKNEMGLVAEIFNNGNMGNSNYTSHFGVQYKRWAKPNIGYRVLAAAGNFSYHTMPRFIDKRGDTVYQTQTFSSTPMYFAGGGVEVQRHFYKKITLYAALELRAGYGSGTYDEVLVKEVQEELRPYFGASTLHHEVSTIRQGDVSAFILDVTPFIGAKLNFKRISLGTEATIVRMGMESVNYSKFADYTTSNFNIGDFRQRIYVNWRF